MPGIAPITHDRAHPQVLASITCKEVLPLAMALLLLPLPLAVALLLLPLCVLFQGRDAPLIGSFLLPQLV